MPPNRPQPPKAQAKASKPTPKPSDRESDPAVRRARQLCDYAYKMIDDIRGDYDTQVGKWETQFGEVLAALAIANGRRDNTLAAVEDERAADAAKVAFLNNLVFSLLTVGAMVYLGEFLKAGLPNIQIGKAKYDFADTFQYDMYLAEKVYAINNRVLVKSPVQFTSFQAAVFGEFAKDYGSALIPLAFPQPPVVVSYRVDSPGGHESLRADFNRNVKESKELVLGEFKKVKQWLNQESEFGEAWAAYTDGNVERARTEIVRHIENLRDGWASKWEFFGKTPIPLSRHVVADLYERAWWASYIIKALTVLPYHQAVTPLTPESDYWESMQLGRRQGKLVHKAIVDRLRGLNVVFAETSVGATEQGQQASRGSPMPEVFIDGAIEGDEPGEARAAYRWAKGYLQKAQADAAIKFFPPAKPRKLEPLKAARY